MRVLLKEGADRAIAETILTLPCGFAETVWGPLLPADGYQGIDEAYVADVGVPLVARAIRAAVHRRTRPGPTTHELYEEVRFTARLIKPYVIGSRILLRVDSHGCDLDCSKAVLTTAAQNRRGPFAVGR